jgi:hypothetical protein
MTVQTAATTDKSAAGGGSRLRSVLVGIVFVLACLAIVLATVIVWTHRTLLVTDRFVALTSRVTEDPAVIEAVSERTAEQVVVSLDIEGRVAALLPDQADALATVLAGRIQEELAARLERVLGTERAQQVISSVLRGTHERGVAILRSDADPNVTLDVLPLAVEGVRILQEIGLVPADVVLPDLTDPSQREAAISRIEERTGRDLPEDFGYVTIAKPEALVTAQRAVRIFDIVAIASVVIAIVLVVLTFLLARRRRRMAVWLGLGAAVSFALAGVLIRGVERALVAAIATEQGDEVVRGLYDAVTQDLSSWLVILAVAAIVLAVVAYLLGRPRWLMDLTGGDPGGWFSSHIPGLAAAGGLVLVVVALWAAVSPSAAILAGIALVAVWAFLTRGSGAEAPTASPTDVPSG